METKYAFRNELKDSSMEQRIRKMLEINDLMNIDDLCRKTGRVWSDIRPILDAMIARGEAERLRPGDYENDDMDFFRLPGPFRTPKIVTGISPWFSGFKRAAKLLFDDKEENVDVEHCFK